MAITQQEMKDVLAENDFVVWKWGPDNKDSKMEGFLSADICQDLIGIKAECFVAALVDENEARFIRRDKFEEKVQGHEKQFPVERIIFGEDRQRIFKDGKLVLLETIIPLNKVIECLNGQ